MLTQVLLLLRGSYLATRVTNVRQLNMLPLWRLAIETCIPILWMQCCWLFYMGTLWAKPLNACLCGQMTRTSAPMITIVTVYPRRLTMPPDFPGCPSPLWDGRGGTDGSRTASTPSTAVAPKTSRKTLYCRTAFIGRPLLNSYRATQRAPYHPMHSHTAHFPILRGHFHASWAAINVD